jgi:hypothetical protein
MVGNGFQVVLATQGTRTREGLGHAPFMMSELS